MRVAYLMVVLVGLVGVLSSVAAGQIGASVTYTSTQLNDSTYQYNFTLTNTGTTNIATFWVGWTPSGYNNLPYVYDLLQGFPSVSSSPGNWIGNPVADSYYGGYSVEWYGLGTSLTPGQSLSNFILTTSDTPAQMSGPSILGIPRATSWVYVGSSQSGGNPQDFGVLANATEVPEPACLGCVLPVVLAGLSRRRGRHARR